MTTSTGRARDALGLDPTQQPTAGKAVAVSPLERRIAETRTMEPQFADAVASGLSPATLIRDAITAVRNVPDLANCTKDSFFGSLMTAAQLGLRPNVASLGHGWVLPYKNRRKNVLEAKWILGYQGMVELAYRSRLVTKITAHTIYANEPHRIAWGTEDVLVHEPLGAGQDRGDMVWHYAAVWLVGGGVIWNAITEADAQQVMRDHVQGSGAFGPWHDHYAQQARKTALRGLWRFMPKTPELSLAYATDGALREGMQADASVAVVETPDTAVDEPTPTKVTREPDPAPAAAEPPAQPAPTPAADEPVDTWTDPAGVSRAALDDNMLRKALIARIREADEADPLAVTTRLTALFAATADVPLSAVELEYLTADELRTLAAVEA